MTIREYTGYNEEEILGLYAAVGWTAYTDDPEALREGFARSLLTLAAYEDGRLAGLIRAVGDGSTIVFVQDILVHPDSQRKGIGSALLKAVLEKYSHVRQFTLVTDSTPETLAFYRSMGFTELSAAGCSGLTRIRA